jgi:alanine-glyoxylate transaminase/serine-glyoxylate transaminase/serine-pyruvate transaminase
MASEKLLLIPGPSPVVPRILDALAKPTVSHVGPDMVHDLKEACEGLKRIVFCSSGEPFIVAGAGTLAMEMAVLNTAGPGDRVLVLSQGYFGDRMAQICKVFGIDHDVLECEWGRAVTPRELDQKLKARNYNVVACTHVDTATGACAPVEEYSQVLEKTGSLFIVDGVCATGGIAERMDAWGVDVVLTAAQKCLGTPPGLAILVLSDLAMEKRRGLPAIPAFYSDVLRWLPIMHDPARYFSTPCVNEVRAFAEALRIIFEEGIEERFERHDLHARAIRAGLAALGFTFFTDARFFASTLSVVRYPEGVADKAFRAALSDLGVVVAGGLGPSLGKVFRMGHMGNLTTDQVRFAVDAMEKALVGLGWSIKPGTGRAAVESVVTA